MPPQRIRDRPTPAPPPPAPPRRGRQAVAGHHHHQHRQHRTAGPFSTRRALRHGQGLLRHTFMRRRGCSNARAGSPPSTGSSNPTFSAPVSGLEWNIRASQRLNPGLIAAFERTFAAYWADAGFEPSTQSASPSVSNRRCPIGRRDPDRLLAATDLVAVSLHISTRYRET